MGLAKPIIDLDVVIASRTLLPEAIERLQEIGYRHEGDKGIPGRESFAINASPPHHLYVCAVESRELRRHIAFRDYLRSHSDIAHDYAALKQDLVRRYGGDIDAYTNGKSSFIERVLEQAGATKFE